MLNSLPYNCNQTNQTMLKKKNTDWTKTQTTYKTKKKKKKRKDQERERERERERTDKQTQQVKLLEISSESAPSKNWSSIDGGIFLGFRGRGKKRRNGNPRREKGIREMVGSHRHKQRWYSFQKTGELGNHVIDS